MATTIARLEAALPRRLRFGIARGLASAAMASLVAKGALLLMSVLLARQLGPEGFGLFTFATGAALLAGRFGGLGWPTLMPRLLPTYLAQGLWGRVRGLLTAAELVTLGCGLLVGLVLWGAAVLFPFKPSVTAGLSAAAFVTLPVMYRRLRRLQFAALKMPGHGVFFDDGIGALLMIALLLVISLQEAETAIALFVICCVVGVVIASKVFRDALPPAVRTSAREFDLRRWFGIAAPAVVGSSSKLLMNKADILMLLPLSSLDQVGLYGAAFRLTYILTFPQVLLSTVLGPHLSLAVAEGRAALVRRRFLLAVAFAACTSIPLAIVLMTFPVLVLHWIFGEAFMAAGSTLMVLAFGQVLAALSVPSTQLLIMSGRQNVFGIVNATALVLNIALNLALIPNYGAFGAAIATATAIGCVSAVQMLLAFETIHRLRLGKLRVDTDRLRANRDDLEGSS